MTRREFELVQLLASAEGRVLEREEIYERVWATRWHAATARLTSNDDDWVLAAPYNDKSLMRNVLAYRTARTIGRYAPRTRFVELVLNGDYRGVYVLTQRIGLGKGRVEVDEDGHTGGYILELTSPNQSRGEQRFLPPTTRRPILYTDPNRDELTAREAGWIRRHVSRFERALYRGGDWRRYLDVPAAEDYVLPQELFKNEDGFYSSTYMPKGRGRG